MKFTDSLVSSTTQRIRPGCYLADPSELEASDPSGYLSLIRKLPGSVIRGRKIWEWDFLAGCAEKLGLLTPASKAVGLGAGMEDLIYYFARSSGSVLATDLYSQDTHWSTARVGELDRLYSFDRFPFQRDALTFQSADMRKLPVADASVDFAWSTSSIEHVPTIRDVVRIIQELARVIKPGGYALLTTEFCIAREPYLLRGLNALNSEIFDAILKQCPAFELAGSRDLSINWLHPAGAVTPRRDIWMTAPTEIAATARMDYRIIIGHSAITPIGFVLKRTGERGFQADNVILPDPYQEFARRTDQYEQDSNYPNLLRLIDLLEAGQASMPLQLRFNLLTYIIDGLYRFAADRSIWTKVAALGCSMIGPTATQDSDALALLSRMLVDLGDLPTAIEVLRRAMQAPGVESSHSVSLMMTYVELNARLNQKAPAVKEISRYLHQQIERGFPENRLVKMARNHFPNSTLMAELLSYKANPQ